MASRPVRVAVFGTGFGATVQVPGFARAGAEVVAIASGRLARAREVATSLGIPYATDDYRRLLDEVEVDLVSIATPPWLHRPMALAAIARGRAVICEKPLALDLAEAREMLAAAEAAAVVHAVDHEFRYLPARARFHELLRNGAVGEPRLLRGTWVSNARVASRYGWWFDAARGGGILGALGSHFFDHFRWCLGEIAEVRASLSSLIPEREDEHGILHPVTADDTAQVQVRFAGGARGAFDLCGVAGAPSSRLEAHGPRGSLIVEDDRRLYAALDGAPLQPIELDQPEPPRGPTFLVDAFAELARRVIARLLGEDRGAFATFADGVAVQELLDAARQASASGRPTAPIREAGAAR